MKLSKNSKLINFLFNYEKIEPFKIFIFMSFSLGFYFLIWIFDFNKKFEEIYNEAPDSKRGFIILFAMPILWYFISLIAKLLFFTDESNFVYFVSIFGWIIISLFSLKYLYDFCKVFGEITKSNGLWWYFLIYPGYFSVILFFLGFNYTLALIMCPLITLPMMQKTINDYSAKVNNKIRSIEFNSMTKTL